ncbi:MAG: hypothetical protein H6884_01720 [Rhodobiaceae bacterium]|nr:hypothetical protein [Rhodobiaceae bacterium]
MSSGFDAYTAALALGVLLVFGVFFWLVAATFIRRLRQFAHWQDSAAERQRVAIEREARHGPTPFWLKALRVLLIVALVAILGTKLWMRLSAG